MDDMTSASNVSVRNPGVSAQGSPSHINYTLTRQRLHSLTWKLLFCEVDIMFIFNITPETLFIYVILSVIDYTYSYVFIHSRLLDDQMHVELLFSFILDNNYAITVSSFVFLFSLFLSLYSVGTNSTEPKYDYFLFPVKMK